MNSEGSKNTSEAVLPTPPSALDLSEIEKAASKGLPATKEIDITFFSHRSRKSTQLIGNKNEKNVIRARREWMGFDLLEPIYVTSIKVYATGYEDYHEMEISFVDNFNNFRVEETKRFDGEAFS